MPWTSWERVRGNRLDDLSDVNYHKKYHTALGGGVACIAVNRPQKYNAFTMHTCDEMFRAFYDASHDPTIGAILLTGEGDHFVAPGATWSGSSGACANCSTGATGRTAWFA